MQLFNIIIVTTVFLNASASIPSATIRVTQTGIDQVLNSLLDVASNKFKSIRMTNNFAWDQINFYNIIFDQFKLDRKLTSMKLQANGDVVTQLRNLSASLSGSFKIRESLLQISGFATVYSDTDLVALNLSIVSENGSFRLLNKGIDTKLNTFKVHTEGDEASGIISWLANFFENKNKVLFSEKFIEQITYYIKDVSDNWANSSTTTPLEGQLEGLFFGYDLAFNPYVEDSALVFPIDAKFWYKDQQNDVEIQSSGEMPFDKSSSKMACIDFDANMVASSAVRAFNESGLGNFVIDADIFKDLPAPFEEFFDCDCSEPLCLVTILSGLTDHCPKGGRIRIESTAEVQDNFHFNDSGIFMSASSAGSFLIAAPDGNETSLLGMEIDFGVRLLPNATINDWTFKGAIEVFYTKVSIDGVDLDALDGLWNFLMKDIVEKKLNEYLSNGLALPQLKMIRLSNGLLALKKQFARICVDMHVLWEHML